MIALEVILEGDGCWQDLSGKVVHKGDIKSVALLQGGMQSGLSSVAFLVELQDGSVVFAETSLAMLMAAVSAFKAKSGE